MTRRLPVAPSPAGPLEEYAARFDDLFRRARAQRESFRRYLEGLLLPAERNKTLTALAKTPSPSRGRNARRPKACSGSSPSPGGTQRISTGAASSAVRLRGRRCARRAGRSLQLAVKTPRPVVLAAVRG